MFSILSEKHVKVLKSLDECLKIFERDYVGSDYFEDKKTSFKRCSSTVAKSKSKTEIRTAIVKLKNELARDLVFNDMYIELLNKLNHTIDLVM